MRCDDCKAVFHLSCVPSTHKKHIPVEDDDMYLCHTCYKEESEDDCSESEKEEEEMSEEERCKVLEITENMNKENEHQSKNVEPMEGSENICESLDHSGSETKDNEENLSELDDSESQRLHNFYKIEMKKLNFGKRYY